MTAAWDFQAELHQWGPGCEKIERAAAEAYTTQLASTHYENFPVLSWWVPPALKQHFANVYAYCRWSDDLADEVGDARRSLEFLDWWEAELRTCYGGAPSQPVMIALQGTIERFDIPPEPFLDLLAAFRRDQTQTRYESFEDLVDYCRCSADPVGRLVLYLCERATEENFALSDSTCTGLQLANFWQDVSVDVGKGRIYLPLDDCRRFGVAEEHVLHRRFTPEFQRLLEFEVHRAEEYLHRGRPLVRVIPGRLRMAVALFGRGGLAILRAVRRVDFDVFARRPKLRKSSYVRAGLGALADAIRPPKAPGLRRRQVG